MYGCLCKGQDEVKPKGSHRHSHISSTSSVIVVGSNPVVFISMIIMSCIYFDKTL